MTVYGISDGPIESFRGSIELLDPDVFMADRCQRCSLKRGRNAATGLVS